MTAAQFFRTPFAVSGDRTAIPEAVPVDSSINYTSGYPLPYEQDPVAHPTTYLDIPRNQFNQLMYAITSALQQYQTMGFPDFITPADNDSVAYSYAINATVRYANGWAGAAAMNYYSLVDSNTANPTDNAKWGLVNYISPELTGVQKMYWGVTLPSGYVWANGTTIGDGSSGATGRANADTSALFTLLWNSLTNAVLPIQTSSGSASTRGANAAVDFAVHKRLPVPDMRDLVGAGKGDMGGISDRGLITTGGSGIAGTTLGANGGAQNVTLITANLAAHNHTGTTDSAGDHYHDVTVVGLYTQGTANIGATSSSQQPDTKSTNNAGVHTHGFTTNSTGAGAAHLNMQPTIICNYIIKL